MNPAAAQPRKPLSKLNLKGELKLHYGFLASHHLELDVFQSHFPAFEFSIQRATWGKSHWEVLYAYPDIGISFWYSPLGGFDELGAAFALYPFINFPLVRGQSQSLNFRLGIGLGYLTRYFNRLDNFRNFAIGSPINFAGSLYLEYRREISRRITLSGGLGLTHFSNGATRTPNYGLNIVTATLGVAIHLTRPNPRLNKMILPELYTFEFDGKRQLDFDAGIAIAYKDMRQQYGESFLVYIIYANLLKQVSWKSKFGIGVDLTYDASDKFIIDWEGGSYRGTYQFVKAGVNAAYQLLIGDLSFVFNFGAYLSGLERSEGTIYQRLTMRYMVTDHLFASLILNSNWGRAEYVGVGIGYSLDFIYRRSVKHD
jgi:hypothetical protein